MVEVSASTLSILREVFTSAETAFCSMAGEMAASVVTNMSSVAILGQIMPTPLAIAPIVQGTPPSVKVKAISFLTVSVVMMASAAAVLLSPSPFVSSSMPAAMGSMESCCPMTPVDATTTSPFGMPV